ncbi:MAG: hypothetical protein K9H61_01255 [Bacteroidia bacterium]|nr:hypothetical protein [Bacteroidia bacterium]MCF8426976.1 hypothetical protein [Bacteroidia bacterium]MCF8445595.1 hypothetical protein [Bacteroidia bacterium]
MKHLLSFLLSIFLLGTVAQAQITYEKRIEIEEKDGYSGYKTFQFGEFGMVVSYFKDMKSGDLMDYYFDFYDSDLELKGSKKIAISDKMHIESIGSTDKTGHTLIADRKGNYVIISIDVEKMELKQVKGNYPKKIYISQMVCQGDFVYLQGKLKKEISLISINWKNGKQKIIPFEIEGIKNKKLVPQQMQLLPESDEVCLFVKALPNKKTSDVYMVTMDNKGKKSEPINLTSQTDKYIISATASQLEKNNYAISGTYSKSNGYASQGFYFSKSVNGKMDFIKFYPFTDMKNFFNYLPQRSQKRIEKKIAKKKAKGKEIDFNYNMTVHGLIKQEDGYVIIGECYYATYRTETYTTTSTVNGRTTTTTHTRQVFDGYQYTHAAVMKFDFNGDMLWNEIFEMYPSEKPFGVIQFISVISDDNNQISMMYADRSYINSKAIDSKGNISKVKKSEVVIKSLTGDKAKYTDMDIKPWFKNNFICFGRQRIKNKEDKSVKKRRNVFFVAKVKYDVD